MHCSNSCRSRLVQATENQNRQRESGHLFRHFYQCGVMPEANTNNLIQAIEQVKPSFNRLVLLVAPSGSGKTSLLMEICETQSCPLINVNLQLSQELLGIPKTKRPSKVDRIFGTLIEGATGDLVVLDDLEVLFDPVLQLDPLRLLKGHSRNKTLVASWNGSFEDGLLTYAEPQHPEYKTYRDIEVPVVSITNQPSASN